MFLDKENLISESGTLEILELYSTYAPHEVATAEVTSRATLFDRKMPRVQRLSHKRSENTPRTNIE